MATLLSWDLVSVVITLFLVYTESATNIKTNKSASLGEDVYLVCNESMTNTTNQVIWRKDTVLILSHSKGKITHRNFTSGRMSADSLTPTELIISIVELTDTGTYNCTVTGGRGVKTMEWNLTITDNLIDNAEHGLQMLLVFTIPSAIGGVALCIGICCMVWLCRKIKKEQTSHCERRGEESNAPSQGHTARREQRQRSQYFERFNSVYGHY
ncbi:uncharacterized protein LOC115131005 isoform X1 [Oncorhynchus nerka]|uniref:uncharacterized protein LOC115131005 isoform X1 n=1 Tax=Oncorhynchus nerka TaxID=8023 RepID=UPI0011308847|nr:uncharacterized protein LOC115131005 isoform X1 [Oncorhynchus nerka]